MSSSISPIGPDKLNLLHQLERKVLWLASWMIHYANHVRESNDGLKVGGHQASSASLTTIMTALYFCALRPEDRVAVKPHASPVFHAIQYLLGVQTRDKLENFRGYRGAQSYPSRTKDIDDVDFSTGSVGLGVAQTLFASLVQDYVNGHGWRDETRNGRMIALLGDAELDEGNIHEAIIEGWKQDIRNCWWIVDYNRQSLDAVTHEGLWSKYQALFASFGWNVVILKYGRLQREAFLEPGGECLRAWIDSCPNSLYSALLYQGGKAWRARLLSDMGQDKTLERLVQTRSDSELAALMSNLGGHDLPTLVDVFLKYTDTRPCVFICYTVKGFGLPFAGHKDNHAGQMTPTQLEEFRKGMKIREGHEWEKFEGLDSLSDIESFLHDVPFAARGAMPRAAKIELPSNLTISIPPVTSTQTGFGTILHEIGKTQSPLADRIVTTSPDVTVSTNLGGWVNRRGLFARQSLPDTFKTERIPSTFNWAFSPEGQHIELGIAESNLFILLSALGLSHAINGERLIPIGTLYDPFIARGLDALNYACYQDARFIVVGTPSGITLAGEGGAHQSIGTPLIGMAQDGLTSFEPAFVDELRVCLEWAFDYLQRDEGPVEAEDNLLPDHKGGAVYLRLSTRPIEQPRRMVADGLREDILNGAYWLRPPGTNCQCIVAYCGVIAPEAIQAIGLIAEDRRDVGLMAVTSTDRLHAGWLAAQNNRERGQVGTLSHIERLLSGIPSDCGVVTVHDGHPAALSWLGSVYGHRVRALGVEHFGQTGSLAELYRHYRIDAQAIIAAVESLYPKRPLRFAGSF